MRKNVLTLQQKLIIQGESAVMIPASETPILELYNPGSQAGHLAIMAVNFLRCGCPSVQIALAPDFPGDQKELAGFKDSFSDFMTDLAIDERFRIQSPVKSTDEIHESGLVITVTRTVAEKK